MADTRPIEIPPSNDAITDFFNDDSHGDLAPCLNESAKEVAHPHGQKKRPKKEYNALHHPINEISLVRLIRNHGAGSKTIPQHPKDQKPIPFHC